MRRLPLFLCVAALVVMGAAPAQSASSLGQHTVKQGETLYCIGRAYGVRPDAIASANGLNRLARLSVGQVLTIPPVAWAAVPAGPVCVAQFASPYIGATAAQATATPTPAVTTQTVSTNTTGSYVVQRGDTLFRIARRYGVTVAALKAANGLTRDLIYPGQVLRIPGGSAASAIQAVATIPPASGEFQTLISLTSPINAGDYATIAVRTVGGARCSIVVVYKSGPSEAQGLEAQAARSDGVCSWTWRVGTNTTPGMWSIEVTTGTVVKVYAFEVR